MRFPLFLLFFAALPAALAQDPADGRKLFENRCGTCHGADGNGGELGPPIARRVANRTTEQLTALITAGIPSKGMPPGKFSEDEMTKLVAFLRTLRRGSRSQTVAATIQTTDGRSLDGLILNQGYNDLQFRTKDNKIHLLRKAAGGRYREVTSQVDWASYDGDLHGNRYTKMDQINTRTVGKLAPKWVFNMPNVSPLETTPVVSGGMMFVTSINECYALDAGTGRQIWHFQRPRTEGLVGNATAGINRGVAISGERIFLETDNAHLIALSRSSGDLLWETEMADWHQNYNSTSAPLAFGNLVVAGTAGGEQGVRGFVAAFDQAAGKEVWRFWTIPGPGEKGSETWKGNGMPHGGGATWFTGSYDASLDTLYWQAGNPGPDYNGDERMGDNLYSDCILALDAKTGKLKWHFQTTPHDLWDWDTTEPVVLLDTNWHGQPRKLLVQANRNGFFYVFDRTDGKLLLSKQFVKKVTWTDGLDANGRPHFLPNQEPSENGATVCPSQDGATNWYSTSFSPVTGWLYVQTVEKCSVYYKRPEEWRAGEAYLGGAMRNPPVDDAKKYLRAIDIQTGDVKWELAEEGHAYTWGGTLTTAGGVVIFCEDTGSLVAADVKTGKPLWSFPANSIWKASPMTYMFDNRQYVAAASGSNIMVFGLME